MNNIINAHGFQCEYHVAQIRPLNFRDCCGEHFIFERVFGVQTVALSRPCAAGTTFALVCAETVSTYTCRDEAAEN
jgi:hypothetical protein